MELISGLLLHRGLCFLSALLISKYWLEDLHIRVYKLIYLLRLAYSSPRNA